MTYCSCLTQVDGSLLVWAARRCCRDVRTDISERSLRRGACGPSQAPVSFRASRARAHRRSSARARACPRRLSTTAAPVSLSREKSVPIALHPNQQEIDEIRASLRLLTEAEVYRLSDTWIDGRAHRLARDCALHPDTPAVPEALRLLLALPVIIPAYVPESIRARAVSALTDAVIAAYGRPRLNPAQYRILMRPYWHAVAFI